MNLDELRAVQSRERDKDDLQHLQDDFYRKVGEYIAELKDQREKAAERADDPFGSPEVRQLTDEIETAEDVAESIYERRIGKLVNTASLAAADYDTNTDGLTAEEEQLFADLVDRITDNKQTVLDVLSGAPSDAEQSSTAPAESEETTSTTTPDHPEPPTQQPPADVDTADTAETAGVNPADLMGSTETADEQPSSPPPTETSTDGGTTTAGPTGTDGPLSVDRVTVQILDDVGEILGIDQRAYDLAADDVVSLPAENAEPLIEQDIAKRLDQP